MTMSPYDLLLMQSQNPDIAKVLGLYWVDRSAQSGTYYDYKVVALWPDKPRTLWKLENETTFEDIPFGRPVLPVFAKGCCIFAGSDGRIVRSKSKRAGVSRGLAYRYPDAMVARIFFSEPVKEVQCFVRHKGTAAILRAFSSDGLEVDRHELHAREGVLAVHDPDLRFVLLEGEGVVLQRVHHGHTFIPYGNQKALICGVKKTRERRLPTPTGLKATHLLGSVTETTEDCKEVQRRFRVGLRWRLPGNATTGIFSGGAVGYLVERTDPNEQSELVTEKNPVHVAPVSPDVESKIRKIAEEEDQPVLQKDSAGGELHGTRGHVVTSNISTILASSLCSSGASGSLRSSRRSAMPTAA